MDSASCMRDWVGRDCGYGGDVKCDVVYLLALQLCVYGLHEAVSVKLNRVDVFGRESMCVEVV